MAKEYTDPVSKLLTYGGFDIGRANEPWPDYVALGFTREHLGELIRMTMDSELNNSDKDSLEVWAPLHAWRTLGQLRAVEATGVLLRLFERLPHDDWLPLELPNVFSLIGPPAIPIIAEYMADTSVDDIHQIAVPVCLERIGEDYPENRAECIDALEQQLISCERYGPYLNAFIILSLTNLKATESIDAIRRAFAAERVDLSIQGDIEDVEIEMGLRIARDTPPPNLQWISGLPDMDDAGNSVVVDFVSDPIDRRIRKVGRNDPCPCGSGKKFKKCCLQ